MSWYNPSSWFSDNATYSKDVGGNYNYTLTEPAFKDVYGQVFKGSYTDANLIALFHSVPEIFAPIHEIASRVADAVWQLKNTWNDEIDYKNPDFNRLFTTPNPLLSHKKFIYQAVCYELVTGKQYFYANIPDTLGFDYRNIVALWNLSPLKLKPVFKSTFSILTATTIGDFIERYNYEDDNRKTETVNVDKVLPFHQIDLNSEKCAKSALISAEKAIRNLIAVYEARGTIYLKRGALGFVVSRKSDASGSITLSPKEKLELRDDFNQTYGLTGNRDTIGITSQPVDFVRTAMSIQEMQPFEETLSDAVAIYKVLRVPRHLVPSKDSSTFANADADMKSFYTDVIIPKAKSYAEAFTNWFRLDGFRKYIDVDFSHIDVLQENKKEKAAVDQIIGSVFLQRFDSGVATLNDWIIAIGNKKDPNPLCDKKIFEMTDDEILKVKGVFRNTQTNAPGQTDTKGQPVTDKTKTDNAPKN